MRNVLQKPVSLARLAYHSILNTGRTHVYLMSDGGNWALDWETRYLQKGLLEVHGINARIAHQPWMFRNQILHFVSRYALLFGPFIKLHSSNNIFWTWYHGHPNDPNPMMRRAFELLPQVVPLSNRIVTSCQLSKEILIAQGVPRHKIVIIPIGIDLQRFVAPNAIERAIARKALGIPESAICIGSFQKDGDGWEEGLQPKLVKGPDVFLETVRYLSQSYSNLVILLTGPARGYVKRGLDKLGVAYIHHQLKDYFDIVSYYHALDIYIIASRAEGGPKALMESWATGVPVVSTRVGMSADRISDGVNGMLAEVGDALTLSEKACRLIEDREYREQCRQGGLISVQECDWRIVATQHYEQLYRPLLQASQ